MRRPAPLSVLEAPETARLRSLPLSYPVGDRPAAAPAGYRTFARRAQLGHGGELFERTRARVLRWQVQIRSGIAVAASDLTIGLGTVARLTVPVGPLRLRAWCRVVEIVDEPSRAGFAYGTLPGHPESGRESFVVSIGDDGVVRLEISAFSRPASRLARLGGPFTHAAQAAMTTRYLQSLRGS